MSLGLAWRFTKTHRWVLAKNVGLFGLYGALYCKTEYQLNNPDSDEAILKKAAIKQRYCYLSKSWRWYQRGQGRVVFVSFECRF